MRDLMWGSDFSGIGDKTSGFGAAGTGAGTSSAYRSGMSENNPSSNAGNAARADNC